MSEDNVTYVQCDLCPRRTRKDEAEAAGYRKVDELDVCAACFVMASDAISQGVAKAWCDLSNEVGGLQHTRVEQLIEHVFKTALEEQVEGAKKA